MVSRDSVHSTLSRIHSFYLSFKFCCVVLCVHFLCGLHAIYRYIRCVWEWCKVAVSLSVCLSVRVCVLSLTLTAHTRNFFHPSIPSFLVVFLSLSRSHHIGSPMSTQTPVSTEFWVRFLFFCIRIIVRYPTGNIVLSPWRVMCVCMWLCVNTANQ